MSIRTKLLLSYIAMIAIPVLLFALTVLTAAGIYMRDMAPGAGNNAAQHRSFPFSAFRDLFGGRNELASGLRFVAKHDPRLLGDPAFLAETEAELANVDAGIVVLTGGDKAAYVSPGLSADDVVRQLREEEARGTRSWQPGKPGGTSLDRIAYTGSDGKGGTLIIVSDMEPVARFFRKFVPTVLLALIGALALTNGVLTFFVSRSIVRPLYALRAAACQIREGDLDRPVNLKRQDEIGQLGSAFEDMRVRLKSSIGAGLQLEQNRKELLASISHDLKTPITAIQGCVECLQDGIADTEEKRQKYVGMIGGKAADMNRMIEELLLYSTLDIGKLPFHFERLDVAEYLRQTVEELRLDPRMNGIRLELELRIDPDPALALDPALDPALDLDLALDPALDPALGPALGPDSDPAPDPDSGLGAGAASRPLYIQADREKLHRAILNIVENSLKHMEREPRLLRFGLERLSPGTAGEAVAIRISDNGSGIPEEALPHVFDRFYRGEPSRRADAGSSGLGLAIVKQIVDEHGGQVRAFSKPGEGTSILMVLPAANGGGHPSADQRGEPK